MAAVTVRFYKTIAGRDRLISTRQFDTVEAALAAVERWEAMTPDNYAVFS